MNRSLATLFYLFKFFKFFKLFFLKAIISVTSGAVFALTPVFGETLAEAASINNEGVKALNDKQYDIAVQKFSAALKVDPSYRLAKQNLAITYADIGQSLKAKPLEALKAYRKALIFNYDSDAMRTCVEEYLKRLGYAATDYKQRVQLGDETEKNGDYPSAVIEYAEALRLHPDEETHKKLDAAYEQMPPVFKTVAKAELASTPPLQPNHVDAAFTRESREVVQLNNEGIYRCSQQQGL